MSVRHVALVAALAVGGCAAQTQYFEPTERVEGASVEGFEAAFYDLEGTRGAFGQAKVWSRGAHVATVDGVERTVLLVEYQVQNRGRSPVTFDVSGARLETVYTERGHYRGLSPIDVDGDVVIAPGEVGEGELVFALPHGVEPEDVRAFRLRWTVRGDGQTYAELTPFVQTPEYRYAPVYAGYYDPFWGYPYYGYGYGLGIGYVHPAPAVIVPPRANRPTAVRPAP